MSSSITIRNLDPAIKERLRVRAAEHGPSIEAEARRILQAALSGPGRPPAHNLYERIHARFAPLGGGANPPASRPAATDVRPGHQRPVRNGPTAFISGQPAELLFTASICQAEVLEKCVL
jgi:antitoxin FitA